LGEKTGLLVAGLYNVFNTTYDNIPGHAGGKGFRHILEIQISDDGSISYAGEVESPYFLHGVAMWTAWGLLGLL
jgi:hypothetical protein